MRKDRVGIRTIRLEIMKSDKSALVGGGVLIDGTEF